MQTKTAMENATRFFILPLALSGVPGSQSRKDQWILGEPVADCKLRAVRSLPGSGEYCGFLYCWPMSVAIHYFQRNRVRSTRFPWSSVGAGVAAMRAKILPILGLLLFVELSLA